MSKTSRLIYSASYKENNKQKEFFTQQTSILWMPISVGQDYHKLDSLCQQLSLLNKYFINTTLVNVVIADTVQRYNLAIKNKVKPEEMYLQAKKDGDIWEDTCKDFIKKNFSEIEKKTVEDTVEDKDIEIKKCEVNFYRWEEWTNHELYAETKQEIDNLYCEESLFFTAIEKDVSDFEQRYIKKTGIEFSDEEKEYCRKCLKEECAVMIVWGKSLVYRNYCCIFYPKPIINSISFINEKYSCFMPMFCELKAKRKKDEPSLFKHDLPLASTSSMTSEAPSCSFSRLSIF